MAKNIRIISIKLENYRQYFGIQNIKFSNQGGFTMIIGDYGSGKSNLINAISWCFYQKELDVELDKKYGIINKRYLNEIKDKDMAKVSVEVEIQIDGDHYKIIRVLKVIKHELQFEMETDEINIIKVDNIGGYSLSSECEIIDNLSTFQVLIKKKHEQNFHPDEKIEPKILMNMILPEKSALYFIIHENFSYRFGLETEQIQIAIKKLLQLHLFEKGKMSLEEFKQDPIMNYSERKELNYKDIKLDQEIYKKIQNKMNEIFLENTYSKHYFKKFIIKDNFEMELISEAGESVLLNLAAGEKLFLSILLIIAIRNATGFKFPLVLDSIFGRISSVGRYHLCRTLSKYLLDDQVIFLLNHVELSAPTMINYEDTNLEDITMGQLLEKEVRVEYYGIKGTEENTAEIFDFTPRWKYK